MDGITNKLASIHPLRRVDRSKYTDPTMPEFPGATLISHVALRGAQVGSLIGCLGLAPVYWFRSGRKEPLLKTVMPRVGAAWMLGGGLIGGAMVAGMTIAGPPKNKAPFTNEGIDDRAFRITHNENIQRLDNFLAAGTFASLVSGRTQGRYGFFGHMSVGMTMASIAYGFVFMGIPEIRRRWPEIRKSLTEAGIDLSILEVPPSKAPEPPPKTGFFGKK